MQKTIIALIVAVLVAGVAVAQTETKTSKTYEDSSATVEVRNATVVTSYGDNLVLRRENGEVYEYAVPPGYKFDIDGEMLTVGELVPGTKLTAQVQTTETEQQVVTTTVRTGEVLHVQGRTVIWRAPEGVKKVVVPRDFVFYVNDQPKKITELRKGMKVTATIVSTAPPVNISERQLASEISGSAPPTAVASVSEPAPMPKQLPATGSRLPLVGLLGLAFLGLGALIGFARRV